MNPFLSEALGSFVRTALAALAGYVVSAGIWTPEDASKYIAAAIPAILALGWSLWQKYKSRLKLVTALSAGTALSESQVETRVGTGAGVPSVTTPKTSVPTS